jgi:hypothetical protein
VGLGEFKSQASQISSQFFPISSNSYITGLTERGLTWNLLLQIWDPDRSDGCREFTMAADSGQIVECFDWFSRGTDIYLVTGSRDNTAKVINQTAEEYCTGGIDR